MRIPQKIAIGISSLAFAGGSALMLGAAPASAQTLPSTPHQTVATANHVVTQWGWGDDWGWGWGDDDWGWGGGWDDDWGWGC